MKIYRSVRKVNGARARTGQRAPETGWESIKKANQKAWTNEKKRTVNQAGRTIHKETEIKKQINSINKGHSKKKRSRNHIKRVCRTKEVNNKYGK